MFDYEETARRLWNRLLAGQTVAVVAHGKENEILRRHFRKFASSSPKITAKITRQNGHIKVASEKTGGCIYLTGLNIRGASWELDQMVISPSIVNDENLGDILPVALLNNSCTVSMPVFKSQIGQLDSYIEDPNQERSVR